MNPTLLDLGFFEIKWYSVLILLAFIIGYWLVISRCKKKGLNTSKISDMCFYLVFVCILGARLYYCIFNFKDYINIIDIFKIWEGGLAIHGGIIAGIIFILNKTVKPVVVWLTLPLTAITLGLFYLVINVLVLKITDFILGSHFEIRGTIMVFFVSIIISIMNAIMDNIIIDNLLKGRKK